MLVEVGERGEIIGGPAALSAHRLPGAWRGRITAADVRKQILDLLNARSDPEKAAAVTAAFAENLIDVNNGDHADEVLADIDTKVIARFLGAE